MSSDQKAKRKLIVAALWVGFIGILGIATKLVILPMLEGEKILATGTDSQYKHHVRMQADEFSGYATFRSKTMANLLKSKEIRITVKDDKADYVQRLKDLKSGDADMAVFTVDSLLAAGVELGEFPATIVMVIDETKGGDAIVAYQDKVPNIQALDSSSSKFVLTPNSPSEFLGRVVMSQFSLPNIGSNWIEEADGAAEVYEEFKKSKGKRNAFVLWEPYVTKALMEPGAHVLLDSSKLSGYIVDVLVARREFLQESPQLVRQVIEAYFRANHSYAAQPGGMTTLVSEDADGLSLMEAKKTAQGIEWKRTLENYAYFRIQEAPGVENLEDVIARIADVQVKTGAYSSNPVAGNESSLFYNGILADLHREQFHPGKTSNLIQGVGPGVQDLAAARGVQTLPALSDEQWTKLEPVGNARIAPLSFKRGSPRLTDGSENDLDDLAKRLQAMPDYYLRIVGHAGSAGDAEANKVLASARAESAYDHLIAAGISETRLHAESADPSGNSGSASQSVSFVLGNVPY